MSQCCWIYIEDIWGHVMATQCMETHTRLTENEVTVTSAHKTCMSADSESFDHRRHGICITNWWHVLWSWYGQYGVWYGQRAWCFDCQSAGEHDCEIARGCCLDSRGSKHYVLYISAIMAWMPSKTCRAMCKDMMDMLDEGFDYLTSGWWETSLSFRGVLLLNQQRQQTRKRWYLFYLGSYDQTNLQVIV